MFLLLCVSSSDSKQLITCYRKNAVSLVPLLWQRKKILEKSSIVRKMSNRNSIMLPYLFNFQLKKDLHIDTR